MIPKKYDNEHNFEKQKLHILTETHRYTYTTYFTTPSARKKKTSETSVSNASSSADSAWNWQGAPWKLDMHL